MELRMEFRLQAELSISTSSGFRRRHGVTHGVPPSGGTLYSHKFRLKPELHAKV